MKNILSFDSFINESKNERKKVFKGLGDYRNLPEKMFNLKQYSIGNRKPSEDFYKIWREMKGEDRFPGIVGGKSVKTERNPSGKIDIKKLKTPVVDDGEGGTTERLFLPDENDENYGKGYYLEYNTYHEGLLQDGDFKDEKGNDITYKYKSKKNSGKDEDVIYFIPWDVKNPYREDKGLKTTINNDTSSSVTVPFEGDDEIKGKGLFTREHAEVINSWLKETVSSNDENDKFKNIEVSYRLIGGSKGETFKVNVKPLPGGFIGFEDKEIPTSRGKKEYEDIIDNVIYTEIKSGKQSIEIDVNNDDSGKGSYTIAIVFNNFPAKWNIPLHKLTKEQAVETGLGDEGDEVEVQHTTKESDYNWCKIAFDDLKNRLKEVEPFYLGKKDDKDDKDDNKSFVNDPKFQKVKAELAAKDEARRNEWKKRH